MVKGHMGNGHHEHTLRYMVVEIKRTEYATFVASVADFGDIASMGKGRFWRLLTQAPEHFTANMGAHRQGRAHPFHQCFNCLKIVDHRLQSPCFGMHLDAGQSSERCYNDKPLSAFA